METLTDANADPSPATEQAQAYEQNVASFTGKERETYQLHGYDAAMRLREQNKDISDEPAASSTAIAESNDENEPASAPGNPQPKDENAEKSRLRRERNAQRWDELLEERGRMRSELDQLRKQIAERAAPKNTPEAPRSDNKPKRPKLTDPKYQVDNGAELFDADMDAYEDAREASIQRLLDNRLTEREQKQSETQRQQGWSQQVETARGKYKDFDAVAFSEETPASFTMIERMGTHKVGAEIAYFWGSHREDAEKLAKLTDIPGVRTEQDYQKFLQRTKSDTQAAKYLGRIEALVDLELERIERSLSSSVAPTKPKPTLPKPTKDVSVEGRAAPVGDALEDAIKRDDAAAYIREANARDLASRRVR